MPDEPSKRRPEFGDGIPVRFPDGQEWHFPRPVVRVRPSFSGGKFVDVAGTFSFGKDYEARLEQFHAAADGGTQSGALLDMAAMLLLRNYDLSDDDLAELLTFDMGDEASDATRQEMLEVVLGHSPKLASAG